jgi:hypothetical protein
MNIVIDSFITYPLAKANGNEAIMQISTFITVGFSQLIKSAMKQSSKSFSKKYLYSLQLALAN